MDRTHAYELVLLVVIVVPLIRFLMRPAMRPRGSAGSASGSSVDLSGSDGGGWSFFTDGGCADGGSHGSDGGSCFDASPRVWCTSTARAC